MNRRRFRPHSVVMGVLLAAALAGCPHNPDPPAPQTASAQTAETVAAATPVAQTTNVGHSSKPAPPKGGPLPPQRVVETLPLDRSCRADADCVVKDIGSCCGAFPSCVNRDSPTDPAAVQAACDKNGPAAHCSRRVLEQCACRQGQCVAAGKTPVGGWVDDAPTTPDPTR